MVVDIRISGRGAPEGGCCCEAEMNSSVPNLFQPGGAGHLFSTFLFYVGLFCFETGSHCESPVGTPLAM